MQWKSIFGFHKYKALRLRISDSIWDKTHLQWLTFSKPSYLASQSTRLLSVNYVRMILFPKCNSISINRLIREAVKYLALNYFFWSKCELTCNVKSQQFHTISADNCYIYMNYASSLNYLLLHIFVKWNKTFSTTAVLFFPLASVCSGRKYKGRGYGQCPQVYEVGW